MHTSRVSKICFALILFFLVSSRSSAQVMTISGTVMDTAGQTPLQFAVTMVVRLSDSLMVSFTRSNPDGYFKMDSLPVDTYQVIISHPQFGDKDFILLGSASNREIDLQKIILPPKSITLNEVTVFGYADPVYFKGDTLVYTADSFHVKNNAVVEDLLKKLPGMRVDPDGKIYSQGKKVDQVLVDGDEFFGADPTIATKNLAASSVESVQVYDKKNENSNESSSDETLKVMNLQLKEDAKKGYFGKASSAGGPDSFYEEELLFNRFRGKQKVSLFALSSNTPRASFGWNDIYQYGLNNEMNMVTGDDGMMYSYMDNSRVHGIPKSLKSGFYYSDQISRKTKLSLNYTYTKSSINSTTSTASQYFFPDTTYRTDEFSHSYQQNQNHAVNLTLVRTLDSLTEVEVQSRLKYSISDQNSTRQTSFSSMAGMLTRITDISNTVNGNNTDWNNSIKLTRTFHKKDRKLILNYNIDENRSQSDGLLQSDNTYYNQALLPNDSIDQKKFSTSKGQSQLGSITYTEPISKKVKVEVSYDVSVNTGIQDKKTLDFVNGFYNNENPALTNNFKSTRSINRFGTKLMYDVKKYSVAIGTRLREVNVSNINEETGEEISQDTKNILPYLTYRYKFSDNQSLTLKYYTNSSQPSLNQLQPVPDNSNPNFIVIGNPDLIPTFSHSFDLSFYAFKPVSGRNVWSDVNFSTTRNAFASSSTYDSIGRTFSQTVNVNGNYYGNGYLNFTIPLFGRVLELNPYLNYNLSRTINYINAIQNTTKHSGSETALNIRLHIDTLEFSVGGSYSLNSSSSSLNTQSNQSYTVNSYDASLSLELPLKMKIETDATYESNRQRTQGYNIKTVLWNASLSKSFLKSENLILAVEAMDMLNQNINTSRNVLDNVISDVKTNVIGRYILFKLTFKVNSNKKKDDGEE